MVYLLRLCRDIESGGQINHNTGASPAMKTVDRVRLFGVQTKKKTPERANDPGFKDEVIRGDKMPNGEQNLQYSPAENNPPLPSWMRKTGRFFTLRGKKPTCKWKDQSVSADKFRFDRAESVGVTTGDGWLVVDFDDAASRAEWKNGIFATVLRADKVNENDLLSQCPIVKTPHGFHLYVQADEAIRQGQGLKWRGKNAHIDIRSVGGYVVAPGSWYRSDAENAAKYPDEPIGTILRYVAAPTFLTAPLPKLADILPTAYQIVTGATTKPTTPPKPRALAPRSTAPSAAAPEQRIDLSTVPFDGSSSWLPATWRDGIKQLAGAAEGTRNGILFGVARYVWNHRNSSDIESRVAQMRVVAAQIGLAENEVNATIDSACTGKPAKIAEDIRQNRPYAENDQYLRDRLGAIKPCEINLMIGIDCGDIPVDDFVVDAAGYLIHQPSRVMIRDQGVLHDESESILIHRIETLFAGARGVRTNFLKPAIARIAKTNSEPLARQFIADICSDGESVGVADLWDHIGAEGGDREKRWLEVCLLQSARRLIRPGAPLENILILWGAQRCRKSTFVPALFDPSFVDPINATYTGPYHTDILNGDLRDEQTVGLKTRGKIALELPELNALARTRDVQAVRDFVTRNYDSYRAPYAPRTEQQPRSCTFVGTANEPPEMADQQGNRRFCLLHVVDKIDTAWIVENRTKIWRGLIQTLRVAPDRVVLSDEENAAKEAALEQNTFAAIPYGPEILDQIPVAVVGGKVSLTKMIDLLTVDKDGPRLSNTVPLRRAVADVMRRIGAVQTSYRYPTWKVGRDELALVAQWTEGRDDMPATPRRPTTSATPAATEPTQLVWPSVIPAIEPAPLAIVQAAEPAAPVGRAADGQLTAAQRGEVGAYSRDWCARFESAAKRAGWHKRAFPTTMVETFRLDLAAHRKTIGTIDWLSADNRKILLDLIDEAEGQLVT